MGYDPIEVNQAARQAVRAIRKDGDVDQSVVIDLTKFSAGGVSLINDIILYLFQTGGGQGYFTDTSGFWDAVNTDRNIKFIIDASAMDAVIRADCTSYVRDVDGNPGSIETSFLVSTSTWMRVTIIFVRGHFENGNDSTVNDTAVTVVVEPLNIPEV